MSVGERLRDLRESAGLKLPEAGAIAGTSKQSVSQIEKGVTKVPGGLFLYRWSKHYGVNLEWLITGKGHKFAPSQPQRPDAATLASAIELGRKAFLELDDETFDAEANVEVVVQAYMFLLSRKTTKVTRSNVIDFVKALEGRQGERGRGVESTGKASGGAGKAGREKTTKVAAGGKG